MSEKTYLRWCHLETLMKELLDDDEKILTGVSVDENEIRLNLSHLYIRYIILINELIVIEDKIFVIMFDSKIRTVLEILISRGLQIRYDISRINGEYFHSFEDILIEKKFTPYDIQLKIPKFYKSSKEEERKKQSSAYRRIYKKIWCEQNNIYENDTTDESSENREMTTKLSELYSEKVEEDYGDSDNSQDLNHISTKECLSRDIEKLSNDILKSDINVDISPLETQESDELKNLRLRQLIGMQSRSDTLATHDESIYIPMKMNNKEKYEHYLSAAKQYWRSCQKEVIEEIIEEELNEWYLNFYNTTGQFPKFPPSEKVQIYGQTFGIPEKLPQSFLEEQFVLPDFGWPSDSFARELAGALQLGGSCLITTDHWIQPRDYLRCQQELEKSKQNKKEKTGSKKPAKEKPKQIDEVPKFHPRARVCISILRKILTENHSTVDFGRNYDIDKELRYKAEDDARYHVGLEIREDIDSIIKNELNILESLLNRKRKSKKGKVREKKLKKIKKNKEENDTTDNMFEELIRQGVMRECSDKRLDNIFIDIEVGVKRKVLSSSDLYEYIKHICILPLGSTNVHRLAPLTRSICFIGPKHTGKKTLVEILASETSASIFDLSPGTISKLRMNKKQIKELVSITQRMARQLQPSIIVINDIEKAYYRKVPKEERESKPRQVQPFIKHLIKSISELDLIQVIGISSSPWNADINKLQSDFEKFIYISPHDCSIYSRVISSLGKDITEADSVSLSKIAVEYGYDLKTLTNQINQMSLEDTNKIPNIMESMSRADSERTDMKFIEYLSKIPFDREKTRLLNDSKKAIKTKKK